MWAFLASDCLFFGSLIATYLVNRGRSLVGPYPHEVFSIPLTSYSAFLLLMSSLTMVLALAAVQRGNAKWGRVWLLATALLGIHFLANQGYEFNQFAHEGLTPRTNLFGASFFTLTGFHGAHVTLGVFWLTSIVVISLFRPHTISPKNSLNVEIAGLYWHFVDIVWIAIFTLVYLLQPAPPVGG
ncbi:MAG: cytochrome c oxidase subunit 3 [Chloroflexi bacterium]|nr:cytochrome c oxidase subunit 3 [Chloroflexota bacterium]